MHRFAPADTRIAPRIVDAPLPAIEKKKGHKHQYLVAKTSESMRTDDGFLFRKYITTTLVCPCGESKQVFTPTI